MSQSSGKMEGSGSEILLRGFGDQIENLNFKDNLDWFIHIRDPREAFLAQPTYFLSEYLFYLLGLLTLVHALSVGGRWKYFWLGCVFHGITTELICFVSPDIDNYWHSQTSIMLLGRRLPLHIPFIYPVFMYTAAYTVSHMKLPKCVEPLACGLVEVLMDLPYDIVAVKFVHWTWHDTDPNIFDRHYWVPWSSYYFHLTFGVGFNFAFNFWRRRLTGSDDRTKPSSCLREILAALLAGLCGMPGGIIQFLPVYQPLHDLLGIHTENCFLLLFVFYFLMVWKADRVPPVDSRRKKGEKSHWSACLLSFGLILHYGLYLGMTIFGHPDREVSIGLHQTTGICNKSEDINNILGMKLSRGKYLCTKDYDEKYFDFHCLKEAPKNGVEWYTICGTPFENREEYITMLLGICMIAYFVFSRLLYKSSPTVIYTSSKSKEFTKLKDIKKLKKK